MIFASLDAINKYVDPSVFDKIRPFLNRVNKETADGFYEIDGDAIYARIETYETIEPVECDIEAHNMYIDIQFSISGAEGISVFERRVLEPIVSYNEEKDVTLFSSDKMIAIAHTDNIPGFFTLLYPEDAHRPKERIRDAARVKKAVIKVRMDKYYA